VKSLLDEPWTAETLRPFFGDRPIPEWFNEKTPAVKSGEVDPVSFDEAGALEIMLKEPILFRRPLLDYGGRKACGFDDAVLRDLLGIRDDSTDLEVCQVPSGRCD
jgi:nitrogenase-associated protein